MEEGFPTENERARHTALARGSRLPHPRLTYGLSFLCVMLVLTPRSPNTRAALGKTVKRQDGDYGLPSCHGTDHAAHFPGLPGPSLSLVLASQPVQHSALCSTHWVLSPSTTEGCQGGGHGLHPHWCIPSPRGVPQPRQVHEHMPPFEWTAHQEPQTSE